MYWTPAALAQFPWSSTLRTWCYYGACVRRFDRVQDLPIANASAYPIKALAPGRPRVSLSIC